MKYLVVMATALALSIVPAAAQLGGKRGGATGHAKPVEGPKIDEKAYKAAMERIPTPKEKYDPWGGVAPAQTPPAATKKK